MTPQVIIIIYKVNEASKFTSIACLKIWSKLQEKISKDAIGEWIPPDVPDYIDYNDQIRDLIAGKNSPWKGNMAYEEVKDIPSMGALVNIPIPESKKVEKPLEQE